MKYTSTLVLFLLSAFFLQDCRDCPNKPVSQQQIIGYRFNQVYRLMQAGIYNYQNPDSLKMLPLDTLCFTFNTEVKMASITNRNAGLFACDPVFPATIALGDSLKIISLDDFDSSHSAGSVINDFFRIVSDNYNQFGQFERIYQPISQYQLFSNSLNTFTLALLKKPATQKYRFKLLIYQKSASNAYELETPIFSFQ